MPHLVFELFFLLVSEAPSLYNYRLSEVGFSHFVKIYKPWFIGRSAFLSEVEEKKRRLVRFTIKGKSQRLAQPGDPLFDEKGKVVGVVTSCSIDSEGGVVGLAMVDIAFAVEGTEFVLRDRKSVV